MSWFLYRRSNLLHEVPSETEGATQEETMVVASVTDPQTYAYFVREQEENLVVYLGDGETLYMETGIRASRLPVNLRSKLENGIGFTDEESLYEFLENYAS
jgi:uncharacterized protein YacL (UPF0231 family)